MYKRRIKQWALDKKLKKDEVLAMLRKKVQRDTVGKASDFMLRGRHVDWQNVERYLRRHKIDPQSLSESLDVPSTPKALRCDTPPPQITRQVSMPLQCSAFEVALLSLEMMVERIPLLPPPIPGQSVSSLNFRYMTLKWSTHKTIEHLVLGIQSRDKGNLPLHTARLHTSFTQLENLVQSDSVSSIFTIVRAFQCLKQARLISAAEYMLHKVCHLVSNTSGQDPRTLLCLALHTLTDFELDKLTMVLAERLLDMWDDLDRAIRGDKRPQELPPPRAHHILRRCIDLERLNKTSAAVTWLLLGPPSVGIALSISFRIAELLVQYAEVFQDFDFIECLCTKVLELHGHHTPLRAWALSNISLAKHFGERRSLAPHAERRRLITTSRYP